MNYTCLRKCINDIEKTLLEQPEKICLNRCAFKYIDSLHYGNRVVNLLVKELNEENNKKEEEFSFGVNN